MKTFYATLDTRMNDGSGSVDLHRFKSKQDRDTFVEDSDGLAEEISSAEARSEYKEQFNYWKNHD